jgi:acetyl esterase/lipase
MSNFSKLAKIFLFALLIAGFCKIANAQEAQPNILRYLDISTGNGLKLDIHAPLSTKKRGFFGRRKLAPVLIYVHGGGWIKGSRKKVYRLPNFAAQRNVMLVSVDYRPVPKTDIDGQVRDVVQGIKWVRKNIKRYGGDPKRIVIMGHSAGSHLVALVSARKLGGQFRGVIPNDVQAYDMVAYAGMRGSLPYVYAKAFGSNPNNWVKWSPITYVRRNSNFPPHLIMHSGSNRERRKILANGFAYELRKKGAKVTLFDGWRYSHGAIASRIGSSPEVTRAVTAFLRKVF